MPARNATDIVKLARTFGRFSIPRILTPAEHHRREFHHSTKQSATPLPIGGVGPPPSPPLPAAPQHGERIERKRRHAEMLRQGRELRASHNPKGKQSPLKKRFWKDVDVKETPDGYHIYLDTRPVRTPHKTILTIPLSKPHLAHAIALEWDLLTTSQQALRNHNIPLTSLASRASDILTQESQSQSPSQPPPPSPPRPEILHTILRYLDTDTLLCWAPTHSPHSAPQTEMHPARATQSLRDIQRQTAQPILSYLGTRVWPGADLQPVLDSTSIVPRKQAAATRQMIRGWVLALPAYELAALERAVLASKSLLVAARLVVEWSEEFRALQRNGSGGEGEPGGRFGIEEAAEACSTEVRWQTGMWGEVEDTHDVEKEDLRRQLGSVVLLVSGKR